MTLIEQELENAALACAKAARVMRNKDAKKEDVSFGSQNRSIQDEKLV